MELNQEEVKGGIRWFFGAGAFAVLFALSLFVIDMKLTHSKRDEILGDTLYHLRLAQTSLASRPVDERMADDLEENNSDASANDTQAGE